MVANNKLSYPQSQISMYLRTQARQNDIGRPPQFFTKSDATVGHLGEQPDRNAV